MITPIQTRYKGYHFRSRTEARWAVFFDALELPWEYEPEGFALTNGWYLPDFRVYYPDGPVDGVWFECKGDLRSVSESEWCRLIEFESAKEIYVLDGAPDLKMYQSPSMICSKDDVLVRPYTVQPEALIPKRSGAALWSYKGRIWYDPHESFFDEGYDMGEREVAAAVFAARSARFEHGEKGAT